MTNKRFTYHQFTRGIKDHQTKYIYEGNQETTDLLNSLYEENEHIKQTIKEAYKNERTALGRSVLKQLIDGVIKNE
jgi:hypothetical protein